MKFYYSPLSVAATLLLFWSLYILFKMSRGAYPTYFVLILPILGVLLLLIDYYLIRKSVLNIRAKLFIQIWAVLLIIILGFCITK